MTEQDDQKTRTDRLFQTVAKFTRKITECNKRIDELLRSQKEIKNDIESIEGIIYEQVLKDDKSEAENIDDFGGLTPDKKPTKVSHIIEYDNNKRNCMCCIYKVYKYDVGSVRGTITCDNNISTKYKQKCDYNDSCPEQITGYRSTVGNFEYPPISHVPYESPKITKKLLAYDFDKDETFEEIVEE